LAKNGGQTPKFIGDYEIIKLLGEGGYARVYLARHTTLGRLDAVKIPREEVRGDPDALAEFIEEAKKQAKLRHPNIVEVYTAGVDGKTGTPYIAMEYMEGGSLRDRIERGKLASVEEAWEWLKKLLDALAHAHREGVIHCDISPENVLFDSMGEPHLSDFGIALAVERSSRTETLRTLTTEKVRGKARYMPPEALAGEYGEKTDVYMLAATIIEAIMGKPYPTGNLGELDQLLRQMMNPDPTQRPTPREALQRLARPIPKPEPVPPPPPLPRRREPPEPYATLLNLARVFEEKTLEAEVELEEGNTDRTVKLLQTLNPLLQAIEMAEKALKENNLVKRKVKEKLLREKLNEIKQYLHSI